MPALRTYAAAVSGLAFTILAPSAFAACGPTQPASMCNPGSVYSASPYQTSPQHIRYGQPYDFLKNVTYKQTPNTNVLRIESGAPVAPLSGAPNAFWGGCSNSSGAPTMGNVYCGANGAPQMPRPIMQSPVMAKPVMQGPAYQGRVYGGDQGITPGHAYVSHNTIVHRVPPVMAPAPVVSTPSYSSSYTSGTQSGGWSQVSGPTVVDGLMATGVYCKQPEAAPAPVRVQQRYQVVRPVIAVRYPVPVALPPVPVASNVPYCSAPAPRHHARSSRYGR